jgi:hypothetical protein
VGVAPSGVSLKLKWISAPAADHASSKPVIQLKIRIRTSVANAGTAAK